MKDTNILLEKEKQKYKDSFLKETDISAFSKQELNWVKNNLDFLYSKYSEERVFHINPYAKFVTIKEEKTGQENEYIILPSKMYLDELYIYERPIEKADKIIHLMINYNHQFTFKELFNALFKNIEDSKRDQLESKLMEIVRKFVSYQYLIIL